MTDQVPPVCPGCHQPATNYPPTLEEQPGLPPKKWWCWSCLNRGGINRKRTP